MRQKEDRASFAMPLGLKNAIKSMSAQRNLTMIEFLQQLVLHEMERTVAIGK